MFKGIELNEGLLMIGESSELVENLFIHWSDYGDDYFDLVICYKETENMFGSVGWVAIPKNQIKKRVKELMEITSIQDVRREKVEVDQY